MHLNKVKGYRSMLGISQQEMADKLGLKRFAYWTRESGRVEFTDGEKTKIKEIFQAIKPNITIDEIFF